MGQHYYHTGQFAQKASVSIRTLRYYDKVGLLSPSQYTEAGYRLYTDTDFLSIQQILALKFLGFSLEEIKQFLRTGPTILQESLALQKAMMQEKRNQLDTIIQAIDETAELLQTNKQDWELSDMAQQGIASKGYLPGPYSNREELLLALDRFVLERTEGSKGRNR